MRFWDASAIVPLCVEEERTPDSLRLHREDPGHVVWWGTPVECVSALARLRREGALEAEGERAALDRLERLADAWYEVLPGATVRARAVRLLRTHPLRSTDALQLAAALEWTGEPAAGELVTWDERLAAAADLEGLTPVPGA